MKKLFFAVILFLVITKPLMGFFYVSTGGTTTIQDVIDNPACVDGDKIWIGDGTYNERIGFYNIDFKYPT